MKNLLVAGSLNTTKTTIATLDKGALAVVSIDGRILKSAPVYNTSSKKWEATVANTTSAVEVPTLYKYVVGLGDGKCIEGCMLNAASKVATKQSYSAGAVKTVTVGTVTINLPDVGEATLYIHTQPKNAFAGVEFQEFVATAPILSTTDSESAVEATLLSEAKILVGKINEYFGKDVLEVTGSTLEGAVFKAKTTDFNFNISFGGAARGTVTVADTLSFGTQAEVIKLEKEMAIATFGYNPNFEAGDNAYGDVLLADQYGASGYHVYVITDTIAVNEQMPLNAGAAKLEQWIALPTSVTFTA